MSLDEQKEHLAKKLLEQKVQVVWAANPTFGLPTDEEI